MDAIDQAIEEERQRQAAAAKPLPDPQAAAPSLDAPVRDMDGTPLPGAGAGPELREPVALDDRTANLINTADLSNYRGGRDIQGGEIAPDPTGRSADVAPATAPSTPVPGSGPSLMDRVDALSRPPVAERHLDAIDSVIEEQKAENARANDEALAWKAEHFGDPAAAHEALTLADTVGLDPTWVAHNLDAVRSQVGDKSQFDGVTASAPLTAAWLADQPVRAAAVKPDLEHMKWMEWALNAVWPAFKDAGANLGANLRGALGGSLGQRLLTTAYAGDALSAEHPKEALDASLQKANAYNQAKIQQTEEEHPDRGDYGATSFGGHLVISTAKVAPFLAGNALVELLTANPVLASGGFNYASSAGEMRNNLGKMRDANGKPLDPDAIDHASTLVGLGNGLLMSLAGPVGGKAAERFAPAFVKNMEGSLLKRAAMRFTNHEISAAFIGGLQGGINSAGMQQAVNGSVDPERLATDVAHNTWQSGKDMLLVAGLGAAHEEYGASRAAVAARAMLEDGGKTVAGADSANRLAALNKAAADAKSLKTMPASDRQAFVDGIAAKSPNVYVDPSAVTRLAQSRKLDPGELAKQIVGDDGTAWDTAVKSGGDLIVPMGAHVDFAARDPEGAAALHQDSRLYVGAPTPRQMKARNSQLSRRIEQLSSLPASAMDDSEREVYEDLRARAIAAGQPEAVADANARNVAAFHGAMAERFREGGAKVNAWDLYKPSEENARLAPPEIFGPNGEHLQPEAQTDPETLRRMKEEFDALPLAEKQKRFFVDKATGLYNFRGYEALHRQGETDFVFGANAGDRTHTATFQPVGVKPLNDYLGHDATDHALKVMANVLREQGEANGVRRGNTISLDVRDAKHAEDLAKAMQDRLGIPVQHGVVDGSELEAKKRPEAADEALKAAKGDTDRKAFAPQFTEGEQPIDYRAGTPVFESTGDVKLDPITRQPVLHDLREGMLHPDSDEAKVIESTAADKARPFYEKWLGEKSGGEAEVTGKHLDHFAAEEAKGTNVFDAIHLTPEGLLTEAGFHAAEEVAHQQAQEMGKALYGADADKLVPMLKADGKPVLDKDGKPKMVPKWRTLVHYVSADARGIADIDRMFGRGLGKDAKHGPADEIMRAVARHMKRLGGLKYNIARPHGDEFYAIHVGEHPEDVQDVFNQADEHLKNSAFWRLAGDKVILVPGLRIAHGIGPDFDSADREALPAAKREQRDVPKPQVIDARDFKRVERDLRGSKHDVVRVGGGAEQEGRRLAEGARAADRSSRPGGASAPGDAGGDGREAERGRDSGGAGGEGVRASGLRPAEHGAAEQQPGTGPESERQSPALHVAEGVEVSNRASIPTEAAMAAAREFAARMRNPLKKAQTEDALAFTRDYLAGRNVDRYGGNPWARLPREVVRGLAIKYGVADPEHGFVDEEAARRANRGGKKKRRDITMRDTGQAEMRQEFFKRIGRKEPGSLDQPSREGEPRFFHLTDRYLGPVADLRPGVPDHPLKDNDKFTIEDNFTPRVSFSADPEKAVKALNNTRGNTLHVYGTDSLPDFYNPASHPLAKIGESFNWLTHAEKNGLDTGDESRRSVIKGFVPDHAETGEVWARGATKVRHLGVWDPESRSIVPSEKSPLFQPPEGGSFALHSSGQNGERGYISFEPIAGAKPLQFQIHLLNKADPSTLSHELFHYLSHAFGELAQRPDAPEQVRSDYAEFIKWMGYDSHEQRVAEDTERRELSAKKKLTKQERARLNHITAKEERATHGWEQFLLEGKSPSMELLPVYTRLRNWMVGIYRSIRAIQQQFKNTYGEDINLTDPVRQIFNRLLAANDEVDRAAAADAMQPFRPLADKMSPEDRARYEEEDRLSKENAKSDMVKRLSSIQKKENNQFIAAKRAEFRKAAEAEVDKNPTQRARRFLQDGDSPETPGKAPTGLSKGGKPYKLDRDALAKEFGPAYVRDLPRRIFAKGDDPKIAPDDLASVMGFDNGRAMLDALKVSKPRKMAVEDEIDKRMGDLGESITENPNALADQVLRALPDDAALHKAMIERRTLARQLQPDLPPEAMDLDPKQLQETVDQIIRRKSVGELLAGKEGAAGYFRRAAATAAQRMRKAFLAGKTDVALAENETHILNLMMWRSANEAREHLERLSDDIKQSTKKAWRETLGKADAAAGNAAYLPAHDAILQAIGQAPGAPDANALEPLIKSVGERDLGFDPDQIRALLASPQKFRALDTEDAENVHDAIKSIRRAANSQIGLDLEGKRIDREKFFADMAERAGKGKQVSERALNEAGRTAGEKVSAAFRGLDAWLTSVPTYVEELDNGDRNGPAHKLFVDDYRKARDVASALHVEVAAKVREAVEEMPKDLRARLYDRVPELQALLPMPEKWKGRIRAPETRAELYALFLNSGNAGNRQRLVDGFGWAPENIDKALQLLKPEEARFLQSMLDTIAGLKPTLAAVHEARFGVPLGEVQAAPITIGGETFAGGYFPIRYHPELAKEGMLQQGDIEKELFGSQQMAPAIFSGFTKAREPVVKAPLSLDFGVLPQHLEEVIHDVALGDWVRKAARVVRDGKFTDIVDRRLGPEARKLFMPWLRDIATQRSGATMAALEGTPGAVTALSAIARNRIMRSVMQLNLPSMLAHTTDPLATIGTAKTFGEAVERGARSIPLVGPSALKATASLFTPRAEHALSSELRFREARELDNLREEFGRMRLSSTPGVRQVQKLSDQVNHAANVARSWMDIYHSRVIFQTGYDEGIRRSMTQEEAARHGDDLLARTLPSGDIAEKPALLRSKGGVASVVTLYGYANRMWNTWMHPAIARFNDAYFGNFGSRPGSAAELAGKWIAMGAIAAGGALLAGRTPKQGQDWEDWLMLKMGLEPLNTTPILGPLLEAAIEGRKPDVRTAPEAEFVSDMVQKFSRAAKKAYEESETVDGFFAKAGVAIPTFAEEAGPAAATMAVGGPAGQVGRTWDYAKAVNDGTAGSPLGVIYGPPRSP